MVSETLRTAVNGALDSLDENATIEDLMERLYLLAKVERGLNDVASGRIVSHYEIRRSYLENKGVQKHD